MSKYFPSYLFFGLFLSLSLLATPTRADEFDGSSSAWNGLLDFVTLARERGLDFRETRRLRWADLAEEDVLIIIYPEQVLDLESLAAFVIDGGRVVLFDDFGGSDAFLGRLSLARIWPLPHELPHEHFVDGEYDWPIFRPTGRHPLLLGVREVVANHPAVLQNVGGPVVAYDHGGGLVYDMKLGEGRVLVIADSSIPINSMLGVADNRHFVQNILEYACQDGGQPCRTWLVAGAFETVGSYGDPLSISGEGAQGVLQDLNRTIRDIFSRLPETELLLYLAVFLAFGTTAYLATVFPFRRGKRWSLFMEKRRQECAAPLTEFDWNLARFSEAQKGIDFALPLAILKEEFEELVLGALGLEGATGQPRQAPAELARRFDERYLRGLSPKVREERRRVVERLWSRLESVPRRDELFLERRRRWSARDLRRIHRSVLDVLGWMGLEEEYERRKREVSYRRDKGPGRSGADLRANA